MLSRIKRKIIRLLRGSRNNAADGESVQPFSIDNDHIVIQKDHLKESLPILAEMLNEQPKLVPHRKVTSLVWNGPIMEISGYYYLDSLPLLDEDLVKKSLVLVQTKKGKSANIKAKDIVLPLKDIKVDSLHSDEPLHHLMGYYEWAGFSGKVNFATLSAGKPLTDGEYALYLRIEVNVLSKGQSFQLTYPLGNIQHLLDNGFHSTKAEYFTAKRQMKYNLIASFDQTNKTMKIVSAKLKDFDPTELVIDQRKRRSLFFTAFSTRLCSEYCINVFAC
ncbi:hypothetical protein QS257_16345 [Terrilactibacillus sp. S3-3]|nr:hypothetical protein QS257_16345 [Terrilactibacillus sp. S3-3]